MAEWEITFLLFCFLPSFLLSGVKGQSPCDVGDGSKPPHLRSDQITVLINGFSESRIPLLYSIAVAYSASPIVSAVLVLWCNSASSPQTLSDLARNFSLSSIGVAPISLIRQSSNSLNTRFLPRSSINTRAVLICDDDVEIDGKSLEFAFRVWGMNTDRLIGFFVRSHDIDLSKKEWMYTVHPQKYSILLTKFMILKSEYLIKYSCGGGPEMQEMRRIVDQRQNCEDILMNFVVADEINMGPILVGVRKARDWGDKRNDDANGRRGSIGKKRSMVSEVGLSNRRRKHRKIRGKCIGEFHRLMGRMPLRYNYGKVIDSVSEQGLCKKGGKLVYCDH